MDGIQLFRKLGVGAKFDFNRFRSDAEKLKLVNPKEPSTDVSKSLDFFGDSAKEKETHSDDEKSAESEDEENNDDGSVSDNQSNDDINLMRNMTTASKLTASKSTKQPSRKKQKNSTELKAALKQEKINHLRKKNHIHVYGTDINDPVESFQDLSSKYHISPRLIKNLESAGYKEPTAVQSQAIPVLLQRRETMVCAPTGSGKTAAFILPILHHLKGPRKEGFRAVVLSPTRELAKQTTRWFHRLSEGTGLKIHYIEKASTAAKRFGPNSSQKFDVLVATPNRLVYLLQQDPPLISLNNVEWLIVDESDKLFEEGKRGFRDQLAVIYKACDNGNIRRALFSATFASDVENWCSLNLDNVVQVHVGARNMATHTVQQELLFVGGEPGKLIAIREIFRKGVNPPVLIFVQSKERAKDLFHELIYDGLNVDAIHADRTQLQRDNVVRCFRSGKIWILISTELMGRGIDFQGVNLVINYDFPNSAVGYIHRIGRTGRAGRNGKAITFFTEHDASNLRSIANVMRESGCEVPDYMMELKRPSRKERKKMSHENPTREGISTIPEDRVRDRKNRNRLKRKHLENLRKMKEPEEKKLKKEETSEDEDKKLENKTEIKKVLTDKKLRKDSIMKSKSVKHKLKQRTHSGVMKKKLKTKKLE